MLTAIYTSFIFFLKKPSNEEFFVTEKHSLKLTLRVYSWLAVLIATTSIFIVISRSILVVCSEHLTKAREELVLRTIKWVFYKEKLNTIGTVYEKHIYHSRTVFCGKLTRWNLKGQAELANLTVFMFPKQWKKLIKL